MSIGGIRSSLPPPHEGALVHRKSLIGFREACREMFGEVGYATVSEALPADVRERTAGMRPLPDWVPLDDLIAWHFAVWTGPARRDEKRMLEHARATVDMGFGRVRRLLLSVATPHTLAPRVVALWREEYSSGHLSTGRLEDRSVHLTLNNHPYVDIPLMRMVMTEVFRYVLSLTLANGVTAVHTVRESALVVVLRWE
jgi:hypothetical protein